MKWIWWPVTEISSFEIFQMRGRSVVGWSSISCRCKVNAHHSERFSHPVDCHRRHLTQAWNSLSEQLWSIEVDATNRLYSRVQPVQFVRAEVDDECCRWDKTLSRRHQHCAIVSWQLWSADLSIAASTVTPEQEAVTVICVLDKHVIRRNLHNNWWPRKHVLMPLRKLQRFWDSNFGTDL